MDKKSSTPDSKTTDTQKPEVTKEIDWEKRYKDTQKSYTVTNQKLKAAEAKNQVLEKQIMPKLDLDAPTVERLEALKDSNPEAWRKEINSLENKAKEEHLNTLNTVSSDAAKQAELERRTQVLNDFNLSHPEHQITEDVLRFDVPQRLLKGLEDGSNTFEETLEKVVSYLKIPKVIGDGNKTLEQPDIGKVGGDDTPTKGGEDKSIAKIYKNIAF